MKWPLRVLLYKLGLWDGLDRLRRLVLFKNNRVHDADFFYFKKLLPGPGLFIDIGANAGQSALSFRAMNKEYSIVSFEANPAMKDDLEFTKTVIGPGFNYFLKGLGSEKGSFEIFVPYVDDVPLTQEAALDRKTLTDDPVTLARIADFTGRNHFEVRTFKVELEKFDDLNLKPDVVKLDVQGHELDVLKGMAGTLKECAPLLLIENCVQRQAIDSLLSQYGYKPLKCTGEKLEPIQGVEPANVFYSSKL